MTDEQQHETRNEFEPNAEQHTQQTARGMAGNVVQGASGGVVTLIEATETVLEEVVHAAGRLGTATLTEAFNLVGTLAGGISDSATALFQGRRHAGRQETSRVGHPLEPRDHERQQGSSF